MRSLDDPGNPYIGQYAEWDVWLYQHPGSPNPTERKQVFEKDIAENWCWESMSVTAEGFPIPNLITWEAALKDNADGQPPSDDCRLTFEVWGEMPQELYQRWQDQELRLAALYYSRIPRWLADNPPKSARIWPDGSVTTHGLLGSYDGTGEIVLIDERSWTTTSEPYCLYGPDGKLLRQTNEYGNEEDLFPGNYDADDPLERLLYKNWMDKMFERARARRWRGAVIENDYYEWYSHDPRAQVEAYDIDGTRYGADFNIWARDSNKFASIEGDVLVKLFAAQQALNR